MTSIRALIFDLDGTLIDSLQDIGSAMNRALARQGLPPHPLEDYRAFVGEGVERLVERALPRDRPELKAELMADYRRDYAENALNNTAPYPGIPALLTALAARGLKLAILSNKPHGPTQEIARTLLSGHPFEVVLGERPGVEKKPHPRAALEIAATLGLTPSELLFVGDTAVDMGTANAAGMTGVGVLWGFRGREELLGAGARHLVESPRDILSLC